MGTREYLNTLNLEQLRFARDEAATMVERIEKEKKIVVWCLEDSTTRIATFSNSEYIKAAEALLHEARHLDSCPSMKARDKELHLVYIAVPESEWSEWLNEKPEQ